MTGTRPKVLVLAAAVAAVLGYVLARAFEAGGGRPLPVPWTALVLLLAMAVAVLVVAWPVRRWNRGDRSRPLDALRAARAAVLAKAAAHAGAALIGWFAGQATAVVGDLAIEPRRDRFTVALVAVLLAAAVTVAGLVAERWCRRRPDPDERGGPGDLPRQGGPQRQG